MRRPLLIALTLILGSQLALARDNTSQYDPEYLQKKRAKFAHMRNTGLVLGGLGLAMTVGGAILMSNGEWETRENLDGSTTQEAQDGAAAGGIVLLLIGIPASVAGIVLGAIGSSKVTRYDKLLQNTTVGWEYGRNRQGMRLGYSF